MSYEQRDNSGVLFRNDKEGNEKRPDYTGKAMVNGEMVEMSAWIKDGKNGKFMSIAFKEPYQKPAHGTAYEEQAQKDALTGDFGDEIPF